MFPTRVQCAKKNLLLCFDAFGTLFKPDIPIPKVYAEAAIKHGVKCDGNDVVKNVRTSFKRAYKEASARNPNYGKVTGLGAEKWWRNVINNTFKQWVEPGQDVPNSLVDELLRRYSTKEGYHMFPDVLPFFQMLRTKPSAGSANPWPWEKTVVGIITNSDDRVPGILESFGLKVGPRRFGTPDERTAEVASEDDISFVVLSYDVGVEKPGREIFDAAVKSFEETLSVRGDGLHAEDWEKLYVGDLLEHDVFGAKKAGWQALMLDRKEQYASVFRKKGKDLTSVNVKIDDGTHRRVGMLKNLGALNTWRGETKPGTVQ